MLHTASPKVVGISLKWVAVSLKLTSRVTELVIAARIPDSLASSWRHFWIFSKATRVQR